MPDDTAGDAYADRLRRLSGARWKRWLGVQVPCRWNLRRMKPGFMLDVGCGIGRNLEHVDGRGVGVDHNRAAVAEAQRRGLTAFTPEEFDSSDFAVRGRFDSMLLAHVVEHMPHADAVALVDRYLPYVAATGKVIFVCPQEAGYRSDDTHVAFVDFDGLRQICSEVGLVVGSARSFPFPRWTGRWFTYNEFVVVASPSG